MSPDFASRGMDAGPGLRADDRPKREGCASGSRDLAWTSIERLRAGHRTLPTTSSTVGLKVQCQVVHGRGVTVTDWGDGVAVDLGGDADRSMAEGVGDIFDGHSCG